VARLAEVPHRGRQVRGTDEDAIDAFDGRDGLDLCQCRRGLHLHQQAHLPVGLLEVFGVARPARRARQAATYAAHPLRRIAHRTHQLACLLRGFDHRHQQRRRADLQHLLDQRRVALRHPHDRMRGIGRHRLQDRQHRAQVVGAVLAVDQQPVEAGRGAQFGRVRVGQPEPQADLSLGRGQRSLEGVLRQAHQTNFTEIDPSRP
jgi:hypothetical protein